MDAITEARRAAGLEIQALVEEFERSDQAAFRRSRILGWTITILVTIIVLGLLVVGADGRYLLAFWVTLVGLFWGGYLLSTRRQREQTARLRELAVRWLAMPQTTPGAPTATVATRAADRYSPTE